MSIALVVWLTVLPGFGQAPSYELVTWDAEGSTGTVALNGVRVESIDPLLGWAYGVCVDPSVVEVLDVIETEEVLTIALGSPPSFHTIEIFPDGWTSFVDLAFDLVTLPVGSTVVAHAYYEIVGPTGSATALTFCDTLGSPPVPLELATPSGTVVPTGTGATITVIDEPRFFDYLAPDLAVPFFTGDPQVQLAAEVMIHQPPQPGVPTQQSMGFAMSLTSDPAIVQPIEVTPAGALVGICGGGSPDFFGASLYDDGWTVGVVYAFLGICLASFSDPSVVAAATYETVPGALVVSPVTTELVWQSGLGSPPVENIVIVGGAETPANLFDGTIELFPVDTPLFRRGDCNTDGALDIADGVTILDRLFSGGAAPPCLAACEANTDGVFDIADAIYIFNYLLLGGPPPAAPFPDCGVGSGAIACGSYDDCF